MALVGVPAPRLPEPPEQITREYVEDLVRTLEIFIDKKEILVNYEQLKLH